MKGTLPFTHHSSLVIHHFVMHPFLLVFEFLGTTELLVIAVVALVLFGPRKLPEIGRSVGKALGEFKRASDDFKRTWEYEVELERRRPAVEPAPADPASALPAYNAGEAHADTTTPTHAAAPEPTIARGAAEDEHAWDVATGRALTKRPDEDELNAS
jgi:sec-independent protein translocase protein TatB